MPKRVCVVGAGASGLTAIKCCLEEGLDVVCYEKQDNWGGLWRYKETNVDGQSSVMKSTIINTSKETGAYSDFPPPNDFPNFMHNRFMVKYFGRYAEKFGMFAHILYKHEILKITPSDDYDITGRWLVRVRRTSDQGIQEELDEVFDGVMICTGHHAFPNMPKYLGLDSFQGRVLHTHGLKSAEGFEDKDVMVVGTGNSGIDAAVELSTVARQVYLSTRRGFWLLYRVGDKGRPFDADLNRRVNTYLPAFVQERMMISQAETRISHADYKLTPKHSILSQHPTMNDVLPSRIQSGTVIIKGKIQRFTGTGVVFDGEEKESPLDGVVFATGYSFKYPFLDHRVAKVDNSGVELYEFVFPPRMKHHTLAMIGMIQPIGPIFPVQEMQCRWYVRVLTGKCKMPSKEVMLKEIQAKVDFNAKNFISGVRHITEVLYLPYLDNLASKIGVKPSLLWMLLTDYKLFRASFFGPFLSYNYRLVGPHAWSGARDAILNYNERVLLPLSTRKLEAESSSGFSVIKALIGLVAIPAVGYVLYNNYPVIVGYIRK